MKFTKTRQKPKTKMPGGPFGQFVLRSQPPLILPRHKFSQSRQRRKRRGIEWRGIVPEGEPVPPWEWRKGCCRREKANWTAAGADEEVGFLYCVGVRPDGVAGWRPLHYSAPRGH